MTEQVIREHEQERTDMAEISAMPALLDTVQAARIIGASPLVVARKCANGTYQAVKVGRAWRINKAKFLQAVGLA
jgi:hypothetical protein